VYLGDKLAVEDIKFGASFEGDVDTSKLKNPDIYQIKFSVTSKSGTNSFAFQRKDFLIG